MVERFPDIDTLLFESGGDNLTLTFSPALVETYVFILDTAEGDKMPRKRGPGVTESDLLIINKTDIAPYVRCDLDKMVADAKEVRGGLPVLPTNALTGDGLSELAEFVETQRKAHQG